jgi:hypothetical protein
MMVSGTVRAALMLRLTGRGLRLKPESRIRGHLVSLIERSAALAACLLVLSVAIVLDRRPYRPGKGNYIPILIIALPASLVLGRHLISLIPP